MKEKVIVEIQFPHPTNSSPDILVEKITNILSDGFYQDNNQPSVKIKSKEVIYIYKSPDSLIRALRIAEGLNPLNS